MYNWSRPKAHEASKSRQTRSCCKMRNLHRGPLGLHLSLRVWKTLEAGLETWKMVQTPQSSLKGNQNLFWILGTQCKAPFAPFHPKIKKKKKPEKNVFAFGNTTAAAAAKLLQSCPTLCNPIDGSPPGSPIPGILQARTLEWVAISFSNA